MVADHFGIAVASLLQRLQAIHSLLAAASKTPAHACSWQEAVHTLILSSAQPQLEQSLGQSSTAPLLDSVESMPRQVTAALHAAASTVATEAAAPAAVCPQMSNDASADCAHDVEAEASAADAGADSHAVKQGMGRVVPHAVDQPAGKEEAASCHDPPEARASLPAAAVQPDTAQACAVSRQQPDSAALAKTTASLIGHGAIAQQAKQPAHLQSQLQPQAQLQSNLSADEAAAPQPATSLPEHAVTCSPPASVETPAVSLTPAAPSIDVTPAASSAETASTPGPSPQAAPIQAELFVHTSRRPLAQSDPLQLQMPPPIAGSTAQTAQLLVSRTSEMAQGPHKGDARFSLPSSPLLTSPRTKSCGSSGWAAGRPLAAGRLAGHQVSLPVPQPQTTTAHTGPVPCRLASGAVTRPQAAAVDQLLNTHYWSTDAQQWQPESSRMQGGSQQHPPAPRLPTVQQQQRQQQQPVAKLQASKAQAAQLEAARRELQLLGPYSQKLHMILLQIERISQQCGMPSPSISSTQPLPGHSQSTAHHQVKVSNPHLSAALQPGVLHARQIGVTAANPGQSLTGQPSHSQAQVLSMHGSASASSVAQTSSQADVTAAVVKSSAPEASPLAFLPEPLYAAIASAMAAEDAPPPAIAATSAAVAATSAVINPRREVEVAALKDRDSDKKRRKRHRAEPHGQAELSGKGCTAPEPAGVAPHASGGAAMDQLVTSAAHQAADSRAEQAAIVARSASNSAASASVFEAQQPFESGKVSTETATNRGIDGEKVTSHAAVLGQSKLSSTEACLQEQICSDMHPRESTANAPLEGVLNGHSSFELPSKRQRLNGALPEDCSDDDVELAAVGAIETCSMHYNPQQDASPNGTSASPAASPSLATGERLAKDALLMLHHDHAPSDMSFEENSRQQVSDYAECEDCIDESETLRPPPIIDIDGQHAYEVSKIIDKKSYRAGSQVRVQYLVRWKGYGPRDDTWQSKSSLRHAQEAIREYEGALSSR